MSTEEVAVMTDVPDEVQRSSPDGCQAATVRSPRRVTAERVGRDSLSAHGGAREEAVHRESHRPQRPSGSRAALEPRRQGKMELDQEPAREPQPAAEGEPAPPCDARPRSWYPFTSTARSGAG